MLYNVLVLKLCSCDTLLDFKFSQKKKGILLFAVKSLIFVVNKITSDEKNTRTEISNIIMLKNVYLILIVVKPILGNVQL